MLAIFYGHVTGNVNADRGVEMEGSIKVMSKAAALLDALASQGKMTPTQLAHEVGEPRSTVYRLLSALAEHDFVESVGHGNSYTLGLRLFSLGNAVARNFSDIREVALPTMYGIHEATGQSVFLAVRRGYEAVCIERVDGIEVQLMILPVGGSLPLHAGSVCQVLLAWEPRSFWEEFSQTRPRRFTQKTITTKEALTAELHKIRERGYAISDEDAILGIGGIGVPVFDRYGQVCAGLSIAGPRPLVLESNFERNVELVRNAGDEVSRHLGYSGDRQPIE